MNGVVLWQPAQAPDGRTYYYNSQTKETQWEKPETLMTPAERARKNSPWTEYSSDGRKYWHNKQTNQTTWEMPQEFKDAEPSQRSIQRPSTTQQTFVAGGASTFSRPPYSSQQYNSQNERNEPWSAHERTGHDRQFGYGSADGFRAAAIPGSEETNFGSAEEAEAAFFKLLKRVGVQQEWTFQQMVEACARDPHYRAVKDPKDRKLAFDKYLLQQREQEKEREKERVAKLRSDFGIMLRRHPEIVYYSRWKTIRPIIQDETIFRSTDSEDERRALFEEYVAELRRQHDEAEEAARKAAVDELADILGSMNLEPYTRWFDAQERIKSNEKFQSDPKFQTLEKSEILGVFENHIKTLERDWNERRQREKILKYRRERKSRDAFKGLLGELRARGHVKAGSKWMNVYPLFKDDHRYTDMLGQPGSTPLDFFWDVVEEDEAILRTKRNEVFDVLEDQRFELVPQTTFDDFLTVMRNNRRTANIDLDSLQLIFDRLKEKLSKRLEESSHHIEKRQRRAIDDLRSCIKHLNPPVSLEDTWERVRSRVEDTPEYKALDSDDLRKTAFDKFQRRLREKADDTTREHPRRHHDRHEPRNGVSGSHRERDRDRDRTRRTRSPETDPYEADRRKAIADRERQHHRTGNTGLSPPPRSPRARSIRDDRDWRDRRNSWFGTNHDVARREREAERERGYVSRSDLRSKSRALDYGEGTGAEDRGSGSASLGRHPRSEESEGSESLYLHKRQRRDYSSHSPQRRHKTPEPPKEDPALQSGSEEGEIEEVEPNSAKE
ncbi:MAG: hypothetical protein Q9165_005149 [Trypethelium subeluteriae]